MFATRMKAIVTGTTGFVGRNFLSHIAQERPSWELIPFEGSILDANDVERAFSRNPEVVFHFAAKVGALASMRDPGGYARTNVEGTALLLEAARRHGTRRFVQLSTIDVYGTLLGSTEESPLRPESPYGATKAAADLLALGFPGIEVVVVRAPSIYGPFDRPGKMVPYFVSRALSGDRLEIYGDGLHLRDWIHVQDVAQGVIGAAESGRPGHAYNLGTGEARTNLSVTRTILDVLGLPWGLVSLISDRAGHGRLHFPHFGKASRELGFDHHFRFLKEFPKTVLWYKERFERHS